MADLPPIGTFELFPFAEPPVPAGSYLLTGDVSGLPGPVQQMSAQVHVTAPRYTLPPDQILSTFPPAGARGAFDSRLPQIVLRRRTLPWERSTDLDADVATTPTPWLALVLVAEGEGSLLTNIPIGQTVTPGVDLGADADVTAGACLEVPAEVVDKVFPTKDDLPLLCHVRQVDLRDTELAMGDDDGWLAVVLGNRLPQPGVKYLACLVNLEGQQGSLPVVPDVDLTLKYLPAAAVFDLRSAVRDTYGDAAAYDTVTMNLPAFGGSAGTAAKAAPLAGQSRPDVDAAQSRLVVDAEGTTVSPARGAAARTGAGWSSAASARVEANPPDAGTAARMVLAEGFSYVGGLAVSFERPPLRFPVLAYWSFTCDGGGDFQYLATNVHVRMLGHVVTGRETPDGDALGPDDPPQSGIAPEPQATRPLPLVTQTGHVQLDHLSREGEPTQAWFRGPLAPAAVPRAQGAPPPIAHHGDQLRRVTPDGQEDLGYAAAFELGRMLALSQPGVVAGLSRWRAEAFGAARVAAVGGAVGGTLPPEVRDRLGVPDPLALPVGDPSLQGGLLPRSLGARASRAVVDLLGQDPDAALGPSRPVADPGVAAADLAALHEGGDHTLFAGLGVPVTTGDLTPAELLATVSAAPAVAGTANPQARAQGLRQVLESTAASLASAAAAGLTGGPGPAPGAAALPADAAAVTAAAAVPDALDELIERATRNRLAGSGEQGGR